jgi:hypothetical protein
MCHQVLPLAGGARLGENHPRQTNALNLCLALCKHLSWQKIKTLLVEWKETKTTWPLPRGTNILLEIRKLVLIAF